MPSPTFRSPLRLRLRARRLGVAAAHISAIVRTWWAWARRERATRRPQAATRAVQRPREARAGPRARVRSPNFYAGPFLTFGGFTLVELCMSTIMSTVHLPGSVLAPATLATAPFKGPLGLAQSLKVYTHSLAMGHRDLPQIPGNRGKGNVNVFSALPVGGQKRSPSDFGASFARRGQLDYGHGLRIPRA